jgi:hydroxyethylthiazole kinase-like sugar kinase family protein
VDNAEARPSCRRVPLRLLRTRATQPAGVQVTDGAREAHVANGSAMLTKITAAGCSVTALIAAFCAALPQDAFAAATHALACFGCAAAVKHVPVRERRNTHRRRLPAHLPV